MNKLNLRIAIAQGWTQIDSPVWGEAVDPAGEITEIASIPDWVGNIERSVGLAEEFEIYSIMKIRGLDGLIYYQFYGKTVERHTIRNIQARGDTPGEAICAAWLEWKEPATK